MRFGEAQARQRALLCFIALTYRIGTDEHYHPGDQKASRLPRRVPSRRCSSGLTARRIHGHRTHRIRHALALANFDTAAPGARCPRAGAASVTGAARHAGRSRPTPPRPARRTCSSNPGSGTFPGACSTDASLADGYVEVKFKPLSGREDQAGGVVWRWKDGDNYYVARANALENNVSLYYTAARQPQDAQVRRRARSRQRRGTRCAWSSRARSIRVIARRQARASSWTTRTSPAPARSASGPRRTASRLRRLRLRRAAR